MQNPLVVSQGEGFIRQYLEMDVQEGKPGADQALEWFSIIESALAEGFIRQYLEMDVQEGKPGAGQALEWFSIIESALAEDRNHISDLERKISKTRLIMS